jgi:hypothetical protein
MNPQDNRVPPEQFAYARWLDWGTRIGLALLAASFLAYALGVSAPYVPFERLAQIWSLPLDQYRAAAAIPGGWGWLGLIAYGDYMNYAGIAFLGLVTIVCYLRVLPILLGRGDRIFALIVVLEIAVQAAAALGLVGAAH